MELHPTPFPVKSQCLKPKPGKKVSEAPKPNAKIGPALRQKRVFGTARNPNIPSKPATEKPKPKQEKPEKPSIANESSEKNKARPRKKSVCFQENKTNKEESLGNGDVTEPQTPVKSPSVQEKPRRSATPYRTAEKCSKCRFDRLETSAYWLGQIKLAESVGKHFVSASFFSLAFDCKAEPLRNIKVELKKYMSRHKYLNEEEEWRNISIIYGLVKRETSASKGKDELIMIKEGVVVQDEDQDQQKERAEEHGSTQS